MRGKIGAVFWWENLKESSCLEDLEVDENNIKRDLKELKYVHFINVDQNSNKMDVLVNTKIIFGLSWETGNFFSFS
jgi:hypothetical protein